MGEIERFDDGESVPGGKRYLAYKTTVAWNNYGKYIDVTKNAIEDRTFQAELDEMKDLSIGANVSQDKSGIQLFNGAFATTRDVNNYRMTWYGDGQSRLSLNLLNCGDILKKRTIRSQVHKTWEGSETIIQAPFKR